MSLPRARFSVRRVIAMTALAAAALVALAAAALAVRVLAMRPDTSPRNLAVVNRSGRPIPRLDFIVSGQTVVLRSVPAGATVTATYLSRPNQADRFAITGSLADGRQLEAGYSFPATHGSPRGHPVFIVGPDSRMTMSVGTGP
jgi:hypothetical protein